MQGSSEENERILISTSQLWPIPHLEGNPQGEKVLQELYSLFTTQAE